MTDQAATSIRIVVGLGNPGRRYAQTRHNVGFRVVDELVRRWAIPAGCGAYGGQVYETRLQSPEHTLQRVFLLQPHTYMNLSGQSVKGLASFYKVAPQDVLVVLDDLALPLGRLRLRAKGSAGGHNGLTDVQKHLGTQEIPRLRIGIGSAPEYMDTADYVLQKFADDEQESIERAIRQAAQAVEDWVFHGTAYAMDTYNRKLEN